MSRSIDQKRRVSRSSARTFFISPDYQPLASWSEGAQWQTTAVTLDRAIHNCQTGRNIVRQRGNAAG